MFCFIYNLFTEKKLGEQCIYTVECAAADSECSDIGSLKKCQCKSKFYGDDTKCSPSMSQIHLWLPSLSN